MSDKRKRPRKEASIFRLRLHDGRGIFKGRTENMSQILTPSLIFASKYLLTYFFRRTPPVSSEDKAILDTCREENQISSKDLRCLTDRQQAHKVVIKIETPSHVTSLLLARQEGTPSTLVAYHRERVGEAPGVSR